MSGRPSLPRHSFFLQDLEENKLVQNLEENGHSFVLQLVDDRQMLFFNKREYGFCPIDIRVDLDIK
jgi:hypothetical protein